MYGVPPPPPSPGTVVVANPKALLPCMATTHFSNVMFIVKCILAPSFLVPIIIVFRYFFSNKCEIETNLELELDVKILSYLSLQNIKAESSKVRYILAIPRSWTKDIAKCTQILAPRPPEKTGEEHSLDSTIFHYKISHETLRSLFSKRRLDPRGVGQVTIALLIFPSQIKIPLAMQAKLLFMFDFP